MKEQQQHIVFRGTAAVLLEQLGSSLDKLHTKLDGCQVYPVYSYSFPHLFNLATRKVLPVLYQFVPLPSIFL